MLHKAGTDLLTSVKPEQINESLSFTLKIEAAWQLRNSLWAFIQYMQRKCTISHYLGEIWCHGATHMLSLWLAVVPACGNAAKAVNYWWSWWCKSIMQTCRQPGSGLWQTNTCANSGWNEHRATHLVWFCSLSSLFYESPVCRAVFVCDLLQWLLRWFMAVYVGAIQE